MRKTVRLKEITEIQSGQGAPQGEGNYSSCGIPFIKAGNLCELIDGKPISEIQKVSETIAQKYKLKLFPKGTVVFAKSGMSCMKGYVYMLESDCYVVNHLACIIPKDVNGKYLKYYLEYFRPNRLVKDTSYPSISLSDIGEMQIFLDDSCQQQEIVSNLDKINRLIQLRKNQLSELDTLIKARFVEMFGNLKSNTKAWPVHGFNDFAKIDKHMIHDFDGYEDYPHIGIDSIEKDTGRISGYRTVAEDGVISGKYLFTSEHIIYSKIRPNLNKVALPNFTGVCSADAYPILPRKGICNREFLAYAMRSEVFLDYILAHADRTNLPKVNRKQVEGFRCPIPALELQTQFAAFVSEVDKSKAVVQKALDEAQLLFDSLMQEYFG